MSFLNDLNPVQREAVKTVDGPVMIIAGAGNGKTRVLTYRAAYLISLDVRPDALLALTFTNKAAEEMKSRIAALVGPLRRSVWMGTFHSMCARLLRMDCESIGFQRNFTIYDSDDSLTLIREIMQDAGISQQQFSPQGIRSRISHAKNSMMSPAAMREGARDPMSERAASVFLGYERKLKRNNAMDFDDLLLKPLELFAARPDILERYHYRFKYILVDEYQDTNRVQYRLIRELGRKHRNICVVGDDAQSIYAFRGADIRNILEFEKDYPDCKVFRLEQNYRSTKAILATADSIIKHNVGQITKDLWTDNPEGDRVTLTLCEDDREEGLTIVNRIEDESRKRKLDLKEFAVLYRTNAQSRSLEDALRRHGIPYRIVGGVAFYKRKEIKDVLSYMRVIANPRDDESILRVINVPGRGIGATTVRKLREFASSRSLPMMDALGASDLPSGIAARAITALHGFHTMMRKYIQLRSEISVSELAHTLVDEIGILQTLKAENTAESLARRENVLELVSALTEFNDQHPEAGLEEFLEEVSLVSDVDLEDFGRNAVTLMTLHAAKGLEFPVVFITGLEEGLFPLAGSVDEESELEEERRLFYVGLTRAMKKVYLSYAVTRYRYGDRTYSVKSRFLDELDQRYLEDTNESDRRATTPYRRKRTPIPTGGVQHVQQRKQPALPEPFYPDSTPNYEDESQAGDHVRIGTIVVHESFGRGRIVALDGLGDNTRAVVDFESVGRKRLMLKFAHLRAV
jgi:ATP-dependent DNA helicase UvrD/PcrA